MHEHHFGVKLSPKPSSSLASPFFSIRTWKRDELAAYELMKLPPKLQNCCFRQYVPICLYYSFKLFHIFKPVIWHLLYSIFTTIAWQIVWTLCKKVTIAPSDRRWENVIKVEISVLILLARKVRIEAWLGTDTHFDIWGWHRPKFCSFSDRVAGKS